MLLSSLLVVQIPIPYLPGYESITSSFPGVATPQNKGRIEILDLQHILTRNEPNPELSVFFPSPARCLVSCVCLVQILALIQKGPCFFDNNLKQRKETWSCPLCSWLCSFLGIACGSMAHETAGGSGLEEERNAFFSNPFFTLSYK